MKKIKAFTLIETIIVIVVFCVGILVVLHGLSQTLRNKEYANTQIKSAFFAREGIEMVFNMRDANYRKEIPWNCIFNRVNTLGEYGEDDNPFCKDYLGVGKGQVLKISMGSDNEYIHVDVGNDVQDFDSMFEEYQIYVHTGALIGNTTGFYYNYTGNEEEKTGFARYLVITGVVDGGIVVNKDKLLKIESHVLYQRGALTGERVMETFIGNYEFKQ